MRMNSILATSAVVLGLGIAAPHPKWSETRNPAARFLGWSAGALP